MPFNRTAPAPAAQAETNTEAQSVWHASLRAPDGSVLSEEFAGERSDRGAWNNATNWLIHTALPQMHDISGAGGHDSLTERSRSRFMDALLSQDDEIVIDTDHWELRLEHVGAESESIRAPIAAGTTLAAFGFIAAIGSSNPFM